jgi:proton-translocating NADH-quinone oxidoreductase chain N
MNADLQMVTPELMLGILGFGLMVIDMLADPAEKRLVGWLGIAGLLITLVPSAVLLLSAPRFAFTNTYAVDPFAAFFKIIAILSAVLVLMAAMEFFRSRPTAHEGDVYVLIVFMVLGLVLMAAAADLILLFLAIEWVSLISYVLAGSLKADPKSNEAGVKYFFYGAAASAVMLYGFTYLYGAGGTTNVYALARRLGDIEPGFLVVAVVLILAGLGFKISLVPFHQWTPDVYEGAPTPITAFLSVGSKAAGFAALLRLFSIALPPGAWVTVLAVLAACSMSVGNLIALSQQNIKRMLAYSSIAHAGYMLIGVVALSAGAPLPGSGIGALLYYLLAYTFTNTGAFAVAIAIEHVLGSDAIPDYAGLSQRAPGAAAAMAVFMLSLTGIPFTALFFGKLLLFGAAIQSGFLWLAVFGIVNSVVSLYYYVGVIRVMYQVAPPEGAGTLPESPLVRVLLLVTVAGTIVLGVFPQPFLTLVQTASAMLKI